MNVVLYGRSVSLPDGFIELPLQRTDAPPDLTVTTGPLSDPDISFLIDDVAQIHVCLLYTSPSPRDA